MAGLTTVALTLVGLGGIAASGYAIAEAQSLQGGDIIYLTDGSKVESGATVKLKPEAVSKNSGKGLTKPGSNFTGIVQLINRDTKPPKLEITNTVRTSRFTDTYDSADFTLLFPSKRDTVGGVPIHNGVANIGTRVKYRKVQEASNSSPKSLANPFYNSVGVVESVDPNTKIVTVRATALKDVKITYTQNYTPDELVFVSLPYDEDVKGIPSDYGFINVGSRVSLKLDVRTKLQKEYGTALEVRLPIGRSPIGTKEVKSDVFLASDSFEKVGVVTALMFDNKGKHKAVVKCKQQNGTNYYDQEYNIDDLQVVGSDGVPVGTVFILGGVAENGVKVKLREEKKDQAAGKALSRATYGYTGTVEEVDPNAEDNLKVQVRSVGTNEGEEASDWYEPEQLEVLDMPKDQGVPIFGGFATVGAIVEVMDEARGLKCLGKPNVGNVGVVMGIDPNAQGGETLNIKCARDLRANTKVTNWYKPTDVKTYVKIDMAGSDIERKEVELIRERAKLLEVQRKPAVTAAEKDAKRLEITGITSNIDKLQKELDELRKKGTTLEGMREVYNRLMEELVKFRRSTAMIDEEYNTAKLDTTCDISDISTESQIRKEAETIVDKYYAITDIDTVKAIIPNPAVAGQQPYISDAPSTNPVVLQRLEKEAAEAIEKSNETPDDEALKTAAKTAADALALFKKERKVQAPRTDAQKEYIKKRDVLVEALRKIVPDGGAGASQLIRSDIINGLGVNVPAKAPLTLPAPATAVQKFDAYLTLVEKVEEAKLSNPDDPIGHLAGLGAGAAPVGVPAPAAAAAAPVVAPAAPVVVPAAAAAPVGAAELNLFDSNANSQAAYTAAPGGQQTDAQKFLQAKAQAVTVAEDALAANPGNAALTQARNIAVSNCKLAAFDLLVESVDNSVQSPADRFLTKLYWERKYKEYSRNEFSVNPQQSFDIMDVVLRKLNESVKKFQESIRTPGDFKVLAQAFDEFNLARESVYTEVHGETTLLEKRISLMTKLKNDQTILVEDLNSKMQKAQQEYVDAVKAEKAIEFYVVNALKGQTEETALYLTKTEPKSDKPPQPQQQGQQPQGSKKQKRRQRGGALSSQQREVIDYMSRLFTNYIRISHYCRIVNGEDNLTISNILVSDQNLPKLVSFFQLFKNSLDRIFKASVNNDYLYPIRDIVSGLGATTRALEDIGLARRQADIDRRTDAAQQAKTDADRKKTQAKTAAEAKIQSAQTFANAISATYDTAAKQRAIEVLNLLQSQRGGANEKATDAYTKLVEAVETERRANPAADIIDNVARANPTLIGITQLNGAGTPQEKLAAYGALVQAVETARKVYPQDPIGQAKITVAPTEIVSRVPRKTPLKLDPKTLEEIVKVTNSFLEEVSRVVGATSQAFTLQRFNMIDRTFAQAIIQNMRNNFINKPKIKLFIQSTILPKDVNDILNLIITTTDPIIDHLLDAWSDKVFKSFDYIITVLAPKYPNNITPRQVAVLQQSTMASIRDKLVKSISNPRDARVTADNYELNVLVEDVATFPNVINDIILPIFPNKFLPAPYLSDARILKADAQSFATFGTTIDTLIQKIDSLGGFTDPSKKTEFENTSRQIKDLSTIYADYKRQFDTSNEVTVNNFLSKIQSTPTEIYTLIESEKNPRPPPNRLQGSLEFMQILENIRMYIYNRLTKNIQNFQNVYDIKKFISVSVDRKLQQYKTQEPNRIKQAAATDMVEKYKEIVEETFQKVLTAADIRETERAASARARQRDIDIQDRLVTINNPTTIPSTRTDLQNDQTEDREAQAVDRINYPALFPPSANMRALAARRAALTRTRMAAAAAPVVAPPAAAPGLPQAVIDADAAYDAAVAARDAAMNRFGAVRPGSPNAKILKGLRADVYRAGVAAKAAYTAAGIAVPAGRFAGGSRKTMRYPMASRRKTRRV